MKKLITILSIIIVLFSFKNVYADERFSCKYTYEDTLSSLNSERDTYVPDEKKGDLFCTIHYSNGSFKYFTCNVNYKFGDISNDNKPVLNGNFIVNISNYDYTGKLDKKDCPDYIMEVYDPTYGTTTPKLYAFQQEVDYINFAMDSNTGVIKNLSGYYAKFDSYSNEVTVTPTTYVGENFCDVNNVRLVFKILGMLLLVAKLLVPLIIIAWGSFDLFKSVTSGKSEDLFKQAKILGIRALIGVLIFFVPSIIEIIISFASRDKFDDNGCAECLFYPLSCDANFEFKKESIDDMFDITEDQKYSDTTSTTTTTTTTKITQTASTDDGTTDQSSSTSSNASIETDKFYKKNELQSGHNYGVLETTNQFYSECSHEGIIYNNCSYSTDEKYESGELINRYGVFVKIDNCSGDKCTYSRCEPGFSIQINGSCKKDYSYKDAVDYDGYTYLSDNYNLYDASCILYSGGKHCTLTSTIKKLY